MSPTHPLAKMPRSVRLTPTTIGAILLSLLFLWWLLPTRKPPAAPGTTVAGSAPGLVDRTASASVLSMPLASPTALAIATTLPLGPHPASAAPAIVPMPHFVATDTKPGPAFASLGSATLIAMPPVNAAIPFANTLYFATERGLSRGDDTHSTPVPDFPAPQATCMAAEGRTLWIGTAFGLIAMDDPAGRFTRIGAEQGLIHEVVWSATTDESVLWIGTQAGFSARHPDGHIDKIDPTVANRGLTGSLVAAFLRCPGRLLVGTDEGLYQWSLDHSPSESAAWTHISLSDTANPVWITALASTPHRIWAGTMSGLVAIDDDPSTTPRQWFRRDNGLPANRITAIAPDGNAVWVGTAAGLAWVDAAGTVCHPLHQPEALAQGVRSITVDAQPSRRLLIGTNDGLLVWHPD